MRGTIIPLRCAPSLKGSELPQGKPFVRTFILTEDILSLDIRKTPAFNCPETFKSQQILHVPLNVSLILVDPPLSMSFSRTNVMNKN